MVNLNISRIPYYCTDKAGNIYSVPLCIVRAFILLLNAFSRYPAGPPEAHAELFEAGAGGKTTVERYASSAAKLVQTT